MPKHVIWMHNSRAASGMFDWSSEKWWNDLHKEKGSINLMQLKSCIGLNGCIDFFNPSI